MARPAGHRNTDFERKERALAIGARDALLSLGAGASFRELAAAMGVSVTNLKHYFHDRDGLLDAISDQLSRDGERPLRAAMELQDLPVAEALERYLGRLILAWRRFGVGRIFAVSIAEGLASERRGRATVNNVLEPSLQSAERLLAALVARGELPEQDLRAAALSLVAPVLVALLHQDGLGGVACRPLDVESFSREHVRTWLEGHGG